MSIDKKNKFMIKRNLTVRYFILLVCIALSASMVASEKNSTGLILTDKAAKQINSSLGKYSIFDYSYKRLVKTVNAEMRKGIKVPVPKDPAGGYTHNIHKQNYITMCGAGQLYKITGDTKYAEYIKSMLFMYANMFPHLGLHPVEKSYARGKLFWQQLNDANWLVYTSQAYDCVRSYLSDSEKELIENQLLIPYANFLSVENIHVFNRIHNHAVWAAAAVGMTGYAIGNNELVERALYGVKQEGNNDPKGFLSQIDLLFSPDGYYTEGPYYQRYSMLPFIMFAQAIDNNNPDLKIFQYRDQILKKAVLATLQMTDTEGKFFPLNDAVKNMSFKSPELINALDIIYNAFPKEKELLSIAKLQRMVMISDAGLKVAQDIEKGLEVPFEWKSMELRDGAEGDQGAIGILRGSNDKYGTCIVMDYASQGMGHGHFDRLGFMMYDDRNEVISEYGAARYVNIKSKHGGRYLPENDTWSKQTVAHNTLVIDQKSQFNGKLKVAEKYASEHWFFYAEDEKFQIVSAKENNAYGSPKVQRTIALINDKDLSRNPIVVDIINVQAENIHTYDLPYYYQGQTLYTNAEYKTNTTSRSNMGSDSGYQHLWEEGKGQTSNSCYQQMWMTGRKFYTYTTENHKNDEIYFMRIGAMDPEFSLRNEPAFMIRRTCESSSCFASTIEIHGKNDFNTELVRDQMGQVTNIRTIQNDINYTVIEIELNLKTKVILAIANSDNASSTNHSVMVDGKAYEWKGPYNLFK